jgi:RNA exonuclease 4
MVEVNGLHNALARVTIINNNGDILLDTHCKPSPDLNDITDYRYDITGINRSDLEDAPCFDECRKIILKLFKSKILIGHGIENDFLVLNYEHPKALIRDTSKYKFFHSKYNQPHSLKFLANKFLNKVIQSGSHDSAEDARAALCLYRLYEERIEKEVINKDHKMIRKKVIEDAKKIKNLFGGVAVCKPSGNSGIV